MEEGYENVAVLLHTIHIYLRDSRPEIRDENSIIDLMGAYTESVIARNQQIFLDNNMDVAIGRAIHLKEFQNPSTSVYKLIKMLKDAIHDGSYE